MRLVRTSALLLATVALGGCGGGSDEPEPVDSQAVEADVSGILETCLTKSFDRVDPGASTDDASVSRRVNSLITAYKANPDGKLEMVDLKAKTMRGAMESAADILDDCKPADAQRINEALTETP